MTEFLETMPVGYSQFFTASEVADHARVVARRGSHLVHAEICAGPSGEQVCVVAEDRPGLLYDLASAISSNGGDIEVVLIDTQAHKAIDVFYVTAGGRKLSPEKQQILGEALERACGQ